MHSSAAPSNTLLFFSSLAFPLQPIHGYGATFPHSSSNVSSHLIAMLCDFVNSTNIPISRRSTQPCSHADLPNLALMPIYPTLLSHFSSVAPTEVHHPFCPLPHHSFHPFRFLPHHSSPSPSAATMPPTSSSSPTVSVQLISVCYVLINNINSDLPSVCYVLINTINSDLPSVCYVLINNINSDLPSVCYVLINNINLTYSLINNINSNLPLTRALISLTNAVMQI